MGVNRFLTWRGIFFLFSCSCISFYHKIGTPQSEDILVYLDTANPTQSPAASVSDDGKYILLTISADCDPVNKLFIVDLEQVGNVITNDLPLIKVVDNFDALYS